MVGGRGTRTRSPQRRRPGGQAIADHLIRHDAHNQNARDRKTALRGYLPHSRCHNSRLQGRRNVFTAVLPLPKQLPEATLVLFATFPKLSQSHSA